MYKYGQSNRLNSESCDGKTDILPSTLTMPPSITCPSKAATNFTQL